MFRAASQGLPLSDVRTSILKSDARGTGMSNLVDWGRKLREAVEQIKTRYDQIGWKTGAPFLAVVYPPEAEPAVFKEWRTLTGGLGSEFNIRTIDVLKVTRSAIEELGCENILSAIASPMPGSNPETELGHMWVMAVAQKVREAFSQSSGAKIVVVLECLTALYPATGPEAMMQALWENGYSGIEGPVIVLITGTLIERRVFVFVDQREESMYRGDIL